MYADVYQPRISSYLQVGLIYFGIGTSGAPHWIPYQVISMSLLLDHVNSLFAGVAYRKLLGVRFSAMHALRERVCRLFNVATTTLCIAEVV